MIYTHKELEEAFRSDYHIRKAIADGRIHKIARGIYSTTPSAHPLEIISKKYPNAIFTMDSAFYFHGLTDVIPDKMYLAAVRTASRRISDRSISMIFGLEKYHEIGKTQIVFDGVTINVYNKERMLVELVRSKRRLPYDYYKEIISSYRKRIAELDVNGIEDYAMAFDTEEYIFRTIQEEVF